MPMNRTVPYLGDSTRNLLNRVKIKSFQGIALKVGDEKLGVLYVNYGRPRGFSGEERRIAETLANHAALALKKTKLLEQVSKARDASKFVAEITTLENIGHTLDLIAKSTLKTLDCDAVTLYTYDKEQDQIGFPPAIAGVWDKNGVRRWDYVGSNSVVRKILAHNKRWIAEDAEHDQLMSGPFVEREKIKSSVGAPLVVRDQTVGVLFVNYRTVHQFSNDEIINIDLFTHQAAVAIRNEQLYGKLLKQVQALNVLNEAGQVMTSSLDLSETLEPYCTSGLASCSRSGQAD